MSRLAEQLYAAGVPVFPCRNNKRPAVNKGESWKDYAAQPPSAHHWPSPLVGVPIPAGCVIIDLDTYKGVTREGVERVLGCPLPWDAALIQLTQHGGQHYAFSVDWPVVQGSGIAIEGLDTRVEGKGYICTGAPDYTPQGFGVFALAYPASLPRLPDGCRPVLEHVAPSPPERVALPSGDRDTETLLAALRHIDPGVLRKPWVKVGLALRHYYHDAEDEGFAVFDKWSSGELWPGGAPENYDPDHMVAQWSSFKPEGGVSIGSLFYEAIQAGWQPPPSIDTAAAFGPDAAPVDQFNEMVDLIQASGGDPKRTNSIIQAIQSFPGNALQRATLTATLTRELKDAGLLTKPIRDQVNAVAPPPPLSGGLYGKNHTENAIQFLDAYYPDAALLRSEETWYAYDGKCWTEMADASITHMLAADMAASAPQYSTVSSTYNMMATLCHSLKRIGEVPPHLVIFQNGVLDLNTGTLHDHTPEWFTTNILPYNFNPMAQCPNWTAFLMEVFEDDTERVMLLQEWFGYMLSSSYLFHKIMFLLGPPRCGKGTIGRILECVVGAQNYTGASLHALTSDSYLESLRTKPVAFSGDTERRVGRGNVDLVIERLKKISGNDAVTFDRKWKSTLSQSLPTRLTLAANQVPSLFDDSGALASRLLVLPFEVSFLGREDPHLFDRLLPELGGVAAWALQGLARLNAAQRFTHPEASRAEEQFVAETYSPLKQFIAETCTLDTDDTASSEELYNAYRAWSVNGQESNILARRTFIGAFKDATRGRGAKYGPHRVDGAIVRGFKGVTVGPVESTTASAFRPEAVR